MDKDEITKSVIDGIADTMVVKAADITPATHLGALHMDTFDIADVLFELEDEYDVELDERTLPADPTVADIVELVAKAGGRK